MEITNDVKIGIGMLVATVLIIAGGAYFSSRSNTTSTDESAYDLSQLVADSSAKTGSDAPKVTVVEFGDFECPACGSLHPTMTALRSQYQGNPVQFVYRHFPLPQHQYALVAAQAAVEAQQQGKFWEFHDLMFSNQKNLKREDLEQYAADINLNIDQFKKALDDQVHLPAVQSDIAAAAAVGVKGTPTLFINGRRYTGQQSLPAISAVIDAELGK